MPRHADQSPIVVVLFAALSCTASARAVPCCLYPGDGPTICQDVENQLECYELGGTYAFGGADCATFQCDATQACCFGGSPPGIGTYCAVVPGEMCATVLRGGFPNTADCAGVFCNQSTVEYYACCLPNGVCVEWPECPGGVLHTDATSCADVDCGDPPTVPCVLGDTCVDDLTIAGCNAAGGYSAEVEALHGETVSCATVLAYNACCLPNVSCVEVGIEDCVGLGGLPAQACGGCGPSSHSRRIVWSLDIGSDAEVSDPTPSGSETLDAGNAYAPGLPRSFDEAVFKYDPVPATDAGPVAPACAGLPATALDPYSFDLDALASTGRSLAHLITPDALMRPIPRFPDSSIHAPQTLLISYDDDTPANYADASCSVPVASTSPAGLTHGTTAARDEIVGISLASSSPAIIDGIAGYLDEETLDERLAPNPDQDEAHDDDVDALDHWDAGVPFHQFSSDHEAVGHFTNVPRFLDPGDVYELITTSGAFDIVESVKIIDEHVHLGLPESTDLDAIEFVWLPDPTPGRVGAEVLALLFSVSDDDPTTPEDESGGLDPRTIYKSHLTGDHSVFLGPLADDVDAIANLLPCRADINDSGAVNVLDFTFFVMYFGQPVEPGTHGDFNFSGTPDVFDFSVLLEDFGCGVPPALP